MTHRCPVEPCTRRVPDTMLMCARHWRMVPKAIQRRVWATWHARQHAGDDHPDAVKRHREACALAVAAVRKPPAVEARDNEPHPELGI